jgi:integrase
MIGFFVYLMQELSNNKEINISEIGVTLVNDYKAILAKLPKGAKTEGVPLKKLREMQGNKKSSVTVKNTFTIVGHFIHWMIGEGYPVQNNLSVIIKHFRKIKSSERKKREPLNDEDLTLLFMSKKYQNGLWERSSEYWVPILALYSGGCRNELVQLEVDDIYEIENVWVIDINERGDKQLKESGEDADDATGRPRLIPVHPKLIELGFIDFVAARKARGDSRLFPEELRNPRGHFGAFGNRFTRLRKELGIQPSDSKKMKDFHSFRHLIRTRLDKIKTKAEGIVDDILGHTSSSRSKIGKGYSHEERIELKLEALKEIHFLSIDWSKTSAWTKNPFAKELLQYNKKKE